MQWDVVPHLYCSWGAWDSRHLSFPRARFRQQALRRRASLPGVGPWDLIADPREMAWMVGRLQSRKGSFSCCYPSQAWTEGLCTVRWPTPNILLPCHPTCAGIPSNGSCALPTLQLLLAISRKWWEHSSRPPGFNYHAFQWLPVGQWL